MTNTKITRREIINIALASPLLAAMPDIGQAQTGKTKSLDRRSFVNAPSAVTPVGADDLTKIAPDRLAMLKKLLPPTGRAAEFADDSSRVGVVNLPGARVVCVFNWEEHPQSISVPLPRPSRVTDFWSGEDLGRREGSLEIKDLPPRSARLLVCK